jgi:hypothetical protein
MSNDSAFLSAIRSRAARIAVGPSTARGQGRAGVVDASRRFLRGLDLRPFGTDDARRFRQALDRTTLAFVAALPRGAQSWGLARKLLNIFLRDCLYTTYLCDGYRLGKAEAFLELPLDSITAKELRRERGRGVLPPWGGVKHLVPETSDLYQDAAAHVARELRINRVHLDAYWWSQSRDSV